MTRQLITTCLLMQLCLQTSSAQEFITPTQDALPGTKKLELKDPLDVVMVRGISKFAEREIQNARENRRAPWLSAKDSKAATEAARQRLRENIGAVDPIEESLERWHLMYSSEKFPIHYHDSNITIFERQLLTNVTEGISAEAQIFNINRRAGTNNKALQQPGPCILLLDDPSESQQNSWKVILNLSNTGAIVVRPVLTDRETQFSSHPDIRKTNMTHREYVYRLGFNMGRHIIGYEVERTLAILDDLNSNMQGNKERRPIILVGVGEGAVIAQYVAALASDDIDAVVLHGYFGPRENVWQEPIYRNVWKQLTEFGDAEIASLIAPTPLIIEAGKAVEIAGPPKPRKGQSAIAAPGIIKSPDLTSVKGEFKRAKNYYTKSGQPEKLHLIENSKDVCGPETIAILNNLLNLDLKLPDQEPLEDLEVPELDERFLQSQQKRLVGELVRHTQMLLARSDKVRAKLWKDVDRSSTRAWDKQAPKYREMVYNSFIGTIGSYSISGEPRSRKIIDEPSHVGYEVVLNLDGPKDWSEENPGLIAGGILMLPKDLKKGERRPVVVCQHGLEGTPMDTITLDESQRAFRAYKGFATQLVKRGFIVYSPQNPYKGYDDFRVLQRKSNPLGRSLFSYIIPQHRRTLFWLATLDYVDADRIAFYGLSYGGKTAVRVPPLLPTIVRSQHRTRRFLGEEDSQITPVLEDGSIGFKTPGYCLSICSADFNEWIRKNVSAEDRYSYIYTGEYEIFEWNMGHVANYAELSWLMAPRPFMVERGHDDGVAPDEWVGWEFAKVRRHYDKLGIGEDTEIEWFNGPHTINGKGTFKFLHKHLNWPEPE